MPTATESPAVTSQTDIDLNVLNCALLDGEQRTVQHLQHAGLLKGEHVTALQTLKRINRAAYADYSGLEAASAAAIKTAQAAFREKAAGKSFAQLVADGDIHALLEAQLKALIAHHSGEAERMETTSQPAGMSVGAYNRQHERNLAKAAKYRLELGYLQEHRGGAYDAVAALVKLPQAEQAIAAGKYLAMGDLAIATGLIDAPAEIARDAMQDTLANAAAHSIGLLMKPFKTTPVELLERWKDAPTRYAVQIRGLARNLSETTEALASVSVKNAEDTPELAQIQDLKSLLSAQLHAATTGTEDPAALAQVLVKAKPLIAQYQQVTLSMVDHFLSDGPAAGDRRMTTLRHHLGRAMKNQGIEQLPFEQAEHQAVELARASLADLAQLAAGNPSMEAKLAALAGHIHPDLAKEPPAHQAQLIAVDVERALSR